MAEINEIVETVLSGNEPDNDLNRKLHEILAKQAANMISLGNYNPSNKSIFERIHEAKTTFDWKNIKSLFDSARRYQKSTEISTRLREKGNDFYKQKKALSALRAYSLAIAFASDPSEQLTAYANRSAVLLQMNRPMESLEDIQRVLSNEDNFPKAKGLKKALLERKQKCEAILKTGNINLDVETSDNKIVNQLFKIGEPHPKIPNAESFVKLEYSDEKGRHLIVTRNIEAGTPMLVDSPFVSVLSNLLRWETNHCHYCSAFMYGGIPCQLCTFAIFCCEKCRKNACEGDNGMHRFEHNYLPILRALNCSHGDIQALRIMAIVGPKKLQQMCQSPAIFQDENKDLVIGYNEKGIYDTTSYLPIFRLISHKQRPTSGEDANIARIKTTLKALVLKEILKEYSNFFNGNLKPKEQDKFEDLVSALLLKHLENVKYNAIALSKLTQDGGKQKSEGYAVALYPLISLCNHSCDPNCAPVKQSKYLKTSLIALKSLKEGDELSITYKPLYSFMKTSERQKFLAENYRFICNCPACEQNWGPANIKMDGNGIGATLILQPSKCESCLAPENANRKQCNECAINDVNKAKEIHKIGEELFQCHDFMEQKNWRECLEKLPKIIDYFGRNGFLSYFPLYHVALDLYKRALVHSVSHL